MKKGHFVKNGHSFPVGPKPQSREKQIHVVLSPRLAGKYRVEKKDLPGNLPGQWQDAQGKTYTIEWLNSFGLKEAGKPDFVRGQVDEDYEILVEKRTGVLFYYLNGVVPFVDDDLAELDDQPDKIAARLRHGDPPVGWGV